MPFTSPTFFTGAALPLAVCKSETSSRLKLLLRARLNLNPAWRFPLDRCYRRPIFTCGQPLLLSIDCPVGKLLCFAGGFNPACLKGGGRRTAGYSTHGSPRRRGFRAAIRLIFRPASCRAETSPRQKPIAKEVVWKHARSRGAI
jgi:hypothetical protein